MTDRIAKVEDLDAIKAFKRAIIKFSELANVALSDAEGEMNRAIMWLETEQRSYWEGQLRKRAALVERCKEAVRMKKIFKDSTGRQQSAIDEEKALKLAQKRFVEAEDKLANVKKHAHKLRKEILMYKGHVQRFATSVHNELPVACAQLDGLLDRLQKYVALEVPEAVKSSASPSSEAGSDAAVTELTGSMSRGQPAEPEIAPTPDSTENREEGKPSSSDPAKSS